MNFLLSISRLLSSQLSNVAEEVNTILNDWIGPLFIAIGGVAGIYAIVLGVQYIKSENDSKRAEAKTRMFNCIIGLVSLIIIGALCLTVDWDKLVELFGYTSRDASLMWNLMR